MRSNLILASIVAALLIAENNILAQGSVNTAGPPVTWLPATVGSPSPETQTVGIFNNSPSTLTITGVSIVGADAADFSITPFTLGQLPATVNQFGGFSIGVEFDPQSPGAKSASVRIISSAPSSPDDLTISADAVNTLINSQAGTAWYARSNESAPFDSFILEVDMATGERTILSSDSVGSGPTFRAGAGGIVVESSTTLLAAFGDIYRIDRATGNRTIVSSDSVGTGPSPNLYSINGFDVEPSGTTALVSTESPTGVLRIDLANGNRTVVSDNSGSSGTGPQFLTPWGLTVSPSGEVYVANFFGNLVLEIDPANGNRTAAMTTGDTVYTLDVLPSGNLSVASFTDDTSILNPNTQTITELSGVFSGGLLGDGAPFIDARATRVGDLTGSIYIADGVSDTLYRVDTSNGDRYIVSSNNASTPRGTGPDFGGLTFSFSRMHLAVEETASGSAVPSWDLFD